MGPDRYFNEEYGYCTILKQNDVIVKLLLDDGIELTVTVNSFVRDFEYVEV